MRPISPEVWRALEQSRPSGEKLSARLALPETTERLLCALDAQTRRHLLIPLQPDEEECRDAHSRGLSVLTKQLAIRGGGESRYLDIECVDAAGYAAFDLIGAEVAEGLVRAQQQPAEIVKVVLAKWRRFWGQLPWQMLTREEQIGLFAELWFLSVWLVPRIGSAAVQAWRGPLASRHDFEWSEKSVEVKGTTSTRGRIHRINGLDQLQPPEKGPLLFFSLRLREEAGAMNHLPSLVQRCRELLASDQDSLDRFEGTLIQAGYSPLHEEEYARLKLRLVDEGLFRVERDFPRLGMSSFTTGLPAGIERVDYEINLSTFDHLRIAAGEWKG